MIIHISARDSDTASKIPKIDGSSAGFIALVVCLCVIIVVSSIAVFFLLRNHEPSKEERDMRRDRNRQYRQQADALASSSPFNYSTAASPASSSWKERFVSIFAADKAKGSNSEQGWVHANEEEDWAVPSGEEHILRGHQRAQLSRGISVLHDAPVPTSDTDVAAVAAASPDTDSGISVEPPIPNPFLKRPRPVISSDIVRSLSPEPLPDHTISALRVPQRQLSSQSGISMRTLEGGTKFFESL